MGDKKECRKSFSEGQIQRGYEGPDAKKMTLENQLHSRHELTKELEVCETPKGNHKPY